MLPINLAGGNVLPKGFKKYAKLVKQMIKQSPVKEGIAYLTIDEKKIKKGTSHRRGGPHMDGNYLSSERPGDRNPKDHVKKKLSKKFNKGKKSPAQRFVEMKAKHDKKHGVTYRQEGVHQWKNDMWTWQSPGSVNGFPNWGLPNRWDRPGADWKVGGDGRTLTPQQHESSYNSENGGLLMVSNYALCKGWEGEFEGEAKAGGDCSHLPLDNLFSASVRGYSSFILEPNTLYLGNSQFVHESLPANKTVNRVLVRITLPKNAKVL